MGEKRRGIRRTAVLVTLSLVAVTGIVAGVYLVTRDPTPTIREELLEGVEPSPDCPDTPDSEPPGEDEVVIEYFVVEERCLRLFTENVAEADADARVEALRDRDDVLAASRQVHAEVPPEAPGDAKGGDRPWQLDRLQADELAALWPAGDPELRVAVIDSGISTSEPQLAGRVLEDKPSWWKPPTNDHGTFSAGLIAAQPDGSGVAGIAPRVFLLDAQYARAGSDRRWYDRHPLGDVIRWAVDHDADVLSIQVVLTSQTTDEGSRPDTIQLGLIYAQRQGVVVVASAGNCGNGDPEDEPTNDGAHYSKNGCEERNQVQYPAAFDSLVMSVGSHSPHGIRALTSSSRPDVDFLAPGEAVVSTCIDDDGDHVDCPKGGTSFSSPLAAGVVVVLRARHPDASQADLLRAIRETADCDNDCQSDRTGYGAGLLDPIGASNKLDEIMGASPPVPQGGSRPSDLVAAYTQVTDTDVRAYVARSDGTSIRIRGIEAATGPGTALPVAVAVSPDGEYVAASDGRHLTVLRTNQPDQQRRVDCPNYCFGVDFGLENTLVTLTSSPAVAIYDVGSGQLRFGREVAVTGAGPFISGQLLAADAGISKRVYVHLAGGQGGVFAVDLDTSVSTRLISAPYDPAAWAVSPDSRYLAVGVQEGCSEPARVAIVDLTSSLDGAALEPSTTTIAGPGGLNGLHELTSLSFSGTDLVAGWTRPAGQADCGTGTVDADLLRTPIGQVGSAPDEVRAPTWELAVPGVAWEATRGDQLLYILGDRGDGGELWFGPDHRRDTSIPLSPDVPLAVVVP